MTTPDVPYRFELTIEVPGSPAAVWDAIATANGISAWMMPTELEEREGGAVVFHMGPDSSKGRITGWDPPNRIVYEEPDWAALTGHDPTATTPLVSEFLVEATSGGTCVVRVVSSAFGVGAEWEQEFFDEMGKGWTPMFDNLRLYLTHFPGQRVSTLELRADGPGTPAAATSAVRAALGIEEVGQTVDVRGAVGHVERISEDSLLVRLSEPFPALLGFSTMSTGDGTVGIWVTGYLFSDAAPAYIEREGPGWQAWLEGLSAGATSTR